LFWFIIDNGKRTHRNIEISGPYRIAPCDYSLNQREKPSIMVGLGAMLFIVALPHTILIKPDNQKVEQKLMSKGMKKCFCCVETHYKKGEISDSGRWHLQFNVDNISKLQICSQVFLTLIQDLILTPVYRQVYSFITKELLSNHVLPLHGGNVLLFLHPVEQIR
jgi:hypothetical protein